ncbi:MAG: hypothetical protein ACR2HI_05050, partial [Gaiella sp.]
AVEAAVLSSLAGLVAMQARFDEARRVYARSRRLWEELGLRYAVAGLTQVGGEIELLAEAPSAAERELRAGQEILETMGGNPLQSALLARSLVEQGSDEEAEALAREAERADGHEIQAKVIALEIRATVAARNGRLDEALELARAAVARSCDTDAPNLRADSLLTLGSCLFLAGDDANGGERIDEARELYLAKGNVAALTRLARSSEPDLPSEAREKYRRPGAITRRVR